MAFYLEGALTVAIALVTMVILPDFPRTARWLSEEEKQLATWRLEEGIGQDDWVGREQSFFQGTRLAAADTKMWILVSLPTPSSACLNLIRSP
jgi:hypothetical protein